MQVSRAVRTRNLFYGVSLGVIIVGFASAPLLLKRLQDSRGVNLTRQERGLTGSQVMRGAYLNTGSQDVGADPDWQGGRYVGKSGFAASDEEVAKARAAFELKKRAMLLQHLEKLEPPPAKNAS